MTPWPPCWWTKTKDLSLASFVRPPEVVHFSIVIGVSRSLLKTSYREDICLQTLLLLFKFANHRDIRPFVSTANEALVSTLMTIGDVKDIFPIQSVICESRARMSKM